MFLHSLTELPKIQDNFCQEHASDEVSMRARQKGGKRQSSALDTTAVTGRAGGRGNTANSSNYSSYIHQGQHSARLSANSITCVFSLNSEHYFTSENYFYPDFLWWENGGTGKLPTLLKVSAAAGRAVLWSRGSESRASSVHLARITLQINSRGTEQRTEISNNSTSSVKQNCTGVTSLKTDHFLSFEATGEKSKKNRRLNYRITHMLLSGLSGHPISLGPATPHPPRVLVPGLPIIVPPCQLAGTTMTQAANQAFQAAVDVTAPGVEGLLFTWR